MDQHHHHVVAFRFKSETSRAQIYRLADDHRDWVAQLDGLVSYACGVDLPDQLRVVAEHVATLVDEKHSVQLVVA